MQQKCYTFYKSTKRILKEIFICFRKDRILVENVDKTLIKEFSSNRSAKIRIRTKYRGRGDLRQRRINIRDWSPSPPWSESPASNQSGHSHSSRQFQSSDTPQSMSVTAPSGSLPIRGLDQERKASNFSRTQVNNTNLLFEICSLFVEIWIFLERNLLINKTKLNDYWLLQLIKCNNNWML